MLIGLWIGQFEQNHVLARLSGNFQMSELVLLCPVNFESLHNWQPNSHMVRSATCRGEKAGQVWTLLWSALFLLSIKPFVRLCAVLSPIKCLLLQSLWLIALLFTAINAFSSRNQLDNTMYKLLIFEWAFSLSNRSQARHHHIKQEKGCNETPAVELYLP